MNAAATVDVTGRSTPPPGRNLLVFSDGTGNSSAKLFKTNVWRIYEALDLSAGDQLALYDDGVGTAALAPLAVLGGAFGWGLKRNVRDLYMFLCRNYREGDRIFVFGFSRGAFTARVLAGLVTSQGLIKGHDGRDLIRLCTWAYRAYRSRTNPTKGLVGLLRAARNVLLTAVERMRDLESIESVRQKGQIVKAPIEFLGVWDTVDAYGLPIDELTRGWDKWVWPLTMPRICEPPTSVKKACHAISLDDERNTFHPLLWDEGDLPDNGTSAHTDGEAVTQVWFAGVHSDVGGGYPDDALAHAPLVWMAVEAQKRGLRFQPHLCGAAPIPQAWLARLSHSAPLHDSRQGLGSYYRYNPRHLKRLTDDDFASIFVKRPKIHVSVFERIGRGADSYAPIVLPDEYAIVEWNGRISPQGSKQLESASQARSRFYGQEAVWNLVWQRRIFYFATVLLSIYMLAQPYLDHRLRINRLDGRSPTGEGVIYVLSTFLPGLLDPWIRFYQAHPWQLLVGGILLWLMMSRGTVLQRQIQSAMRRVWDHSLASPGATVSVPDPPTDAIFRLRTSKPYRYSFRFLTRTLLPHVFGILMLLTLVFGAFLVVHRGSFELASLAGVVCAGSDARAIEKTERIELRPEQPCSASGYRVVKGRRYEVSIQLPAEGSPGNPAAAGIWKDASVPVLSAAGIPSGTGRAFRYGLPFRRIILAPWYAPILRLGSRGSAHHVLGPTPIVIEAHRDAELFLFVNDGVLPWPFQWWFYGNNTGGPGVVTVTPK